MTKSVTLGIASDYEVFITGYLPHMTHSRVRFSTGNWGRQRNNYSEAQVSCNFWTDLFNPENLRAKPWSHGLRIERQGADGMSSDMVWWGPIRRIEIDPNTDRADVFAVDAMGLPSKRRLRTNGPDDLDRARKELSLDDVDVAGVFATLVSESGDLRGLVSPDFATGINTSRVFKVRDYEYIASAINELSENIRWTVIANQLVGIGVEGIAGSPLSEGGEFFPTYGPFNTRVFAEKPRVVEEGDEQATEVVIVGAENGEEGFRQAWIQKRDHSATGELVKIVPSTFVRPTDTSETKWDDFFNNMAKNMLDTWYEAPITMNGGSLTYRAPLLINQIIPGTAWALDLESGGRPLYQGVQLLDSIQVDIAKSEGSVAETIRPILQPLSTVGLNI